MKLNQVLGLCLPTVNYQCITKFLLPSVRQLLPLKDICTFLINFQPPYGINIDEVVRELQSLGFAVEYSYNTYDTSVNIPINKIRNDAARLMPEALIYGIIDDDMTFCGPSPTISKSSGEQYLDIVRYMLEFKNCGTVVCGGQLYKKVPTHHIGLVEIDNTYLNSKGLFFKNLKIDNPLEDVWITPSDSEWVLGADEEKIAAACRLARGYYTAKMRGTRVRHYENIKVRGTDGSSSTHWDEFELVENNTTKYIREHYNPDFKGNRSTINDGNYYNVVKYQDYLDAGGVSINSDNINYYTKDFTNISVEDNLKWIKEYIGNE